MRCYEGLEDLCVRMPLHSTSTAAMVELRVSQQRGLILNLVSFLGWLEISFCYRQMGELPMGQELQFDALGQK
jgi:hypothetical protein